MPELRLPLAAPKPDGPYENPVTRVRARVEAGQLVCQLPAPSFVGRELARVFALDDMALVRWHEANRAATAAALPGPRLAAAAGDAWWGYVFARPALRQVWPSMEVVLPELALFAARTGHAVVRVMVWPEEASIIVLPDAADYVVVKRTALPMGPPRPPAPAPFIAMDEVLERTEAVRRRSEVPAGAPHWLYRADDSHQALMAALRRGPGTPARDFRGVTPDQVLDAAAA